MQQKSSMQIMKKIVADRLLGKLLVVPNNSFGNIFQLSTGSGTITE